MNSCTCANPLKNTGKSACDYIPGVTTTEYFMSAYDGAGNRNCIDLSDTLDEQYIQDRLNDADPLKRWYPIQDIKNFDDPRAASQFKTFDDGSKFLTQRGTRAVSYVVPVVSSAWYGQIENGFNCAVIAKFEVDENGALIGKEEEANPGFFYPRLVAKGTFDSILGKAKSNDVQQVAISYDIDRREKDGEIRAILSSQFDNIDLNSYNGLLDVEVEIVSTSQTAMVFKLKTKFGNGIERLLDKGLTAAELISSVTAATSKVRNTTSGADVSVTSLSEDTEGGTYTIGYSSQTVGHVLKVLPKRNGREYTSASGTVA